MSPKIDRRVKRTKKLLQSSLVALMETKPVKDITIKELTDFADINRSTFYLHYSSVDEILNELEQELLDQLCEVFNTHPQNRQEDSFSFISHMLRVFFDNQETCNILLNPQYNTGFIEKVQTLLDQKVAERLKELLGREVKISRYLSAFYITGCMGMLRVWQFDENRPSPDQMAQMCYGLIMNTIEQMKQESSVELDRFGKNIGNK